LAGFEVSAYGRFSDVHRGYQFQFSRVPQGREAVGGLTLGALAVDPLASVVRGEVSATGKTIEITSGKIRGTVHNGIHAFKGIPYGAPTGGKMRFMAPAKPASWSGVRDCVAFGHQSPQNMNYVEVLAPQTNGAAEGYDEDCLCLNVWTPDSSTSRKRPIMC
jgi:para-nitrobenzyl esterase